MEVKLANDRRSVALAVEGTFTGPELETLISDLAALRNQVEPEVSRKIKTRSSLDTKVSIQDDPDFQLRLLRDGRIRLWIRNRGLGWLVFNFPVNQACAMRDYLVANTPIDQTGADFFLEEGPDGGHSH